MKATFEKTVDILVKAYLNDTLEHGNCTACAVGNIIRANGVHLEKDMGAQFLETSWLRKIKVESRKERLYGNFNEQIAIQQIQCTGYSVYELDKIEYAFENVPVGSSEDEWMLNGLMAVVDVLADIHGIDLQAKEEAKLLFVKA